MKENDIEILKETNMNGQIFSNSDNNNFNKLSNKGDDTMSNTTYEPTKQQCNPYTFPNLHWADFADPKTYTIDSLGDLIPQSEDPSSVIRGKVELLENLTVYVNDVARKVHQQEMIHWFTRLVQALEDNGAFDHILTEKYCWFGIEINTIVEAVFPQPQAGRVVSVDKEAWQMTINTMDRLCERLEYFEQWYVDRVKRGYQECFDALCYLESKNALPVLLEHLDVEKVLQQKRREHLKAQPKIKAEKLCVIIKENPGLKLKELVNLVQNTESHIRKLLKELEAHDKVYTMLSYDQGTPYRYYISEKD